MSPVTNLSPIVSKIFCAPTPVVFIVRNRPHVVNGGGLVVTDSNHKEVFRVEGCGTLGTKRELVLRDGDGELLLLIRRKGGVVQALSVHKQWRGYMADYEGVEKLVFSMKEPTSWASRSRPIRVTIGPKSHTRHWDFEIKGSFVERSCSINDHGGNFVAQVMAMEEVESVGSKEIYHVVVQPGFDQAFVFGVIAVLDNIYGGSTRC
ncbi:protein LURP-one-related 6 [Cinnamomum micranthum f. kanehirae]|uniref:Protein LURP-one-related 6 n=1 Tax=Cinnamomum micranthum f. kanehirae TaxID=337451 RepID=A0A443PYQ8_9MAGN|nr:protein LURP-one-related 6 [Cinnamomum micranthum f. kanehirae]